MKPRKKKLTAGPRRKQAVCVGGPFGGEQLLLRTSSTLPFKVKGMSGRYNREMVWEESK